MSGVDGVLTGVFDCTCISLVETVYMTVEHEVAFVCSLLGGVQSNINQENERARPSIVHLQLGPTDRCCRVCIVLLHITAIHMMVCIIMVYKQHVPPARLHNLAIAMTITHTPSPQTHRVSSQWLLHHRRIRSWHAYCMCPSNRVLPALYTITGE